jgi:Sulfotransferase family
MDVIASGVQACPWGLHRYGFDGFAAEHPGSSVTAVGSYWLAAAQSIMAFEERHPGGCLRVRYEDLVTAPEETAAAIFSFLGEARVPDIAQACLQAPHEGNGPGDEGIWFTGEITADAVGCGVQVSVAALLTEVRQSVNEVLAQHAEVRWRFAASEGTSSPSADGNGGPVRPVCTIIAGTKTWRALLSGEVNLVTEMTAGQLRCVNRRDGHRIRSDEVHAIGWLLGLIRVPLIR